MPSLIVETSGLRRGGPITSRVLIGRLPTNGVILADSSVSRLHAWIECDLDGNYYVGNTGSLTGTWVNGKAVERRHELRDGDVIRIGKSHLTYQESNELPPGTQPANLSGQPPRQDVDEAGVLFECVCGAPVWFKATTIGQVHKCRQCGTNVIIPGEAGARAVPLDAPIAATEHHATNGLAEAYITVPTAAAEPAASPPMENGLTESYSHPSTPLATAESRVIEHGLSESFGDGSRPSPTQPSSAARAPIDTNGQTVETPETRPRGGDDAYGIGESFLGRSVAVESGPSPNTAFPPEHGLAEFDAPARPMPPGATPGAAVATDPKDRAWPDGSADVEETSPNELHHQSRAGLHTTAHCENGTAAESPAASDEDTAPSDSEAYDVAAETDDAAQPQGDSPYEGDGIDPPGDAPAAEQEPAEPRDGPPRPEHYIAPETVEPPSAPAEPAVAKVRPSLFAQRRVLPEPQPLAAPMAKDPSEFAEPPAVPHFTGHAAAVVDAAPRDAFDAYTADESREHGTLTADEIDAHAADASVSSAVLPASYPHYPDPHDDDATTATQTCSVCHTAIHHGEATTACPSCGLTFHGECWQENQGCSAYGCPQVGALAPTETAAADERSQRGAGAAEKISNDSSAEPEAETFPWEYVFLAASVVGTLMGLLVFGVPALISGLGTLIFKTRFHDPARRNGVILLSIGLSLLGVGLGVLTSFYWWFGGFSGIPGGRVPSR